MKMRGEEKQPFHYNEFKNDEIAEVEKVAKK